jgi:2-haloalkanoic acid dehalogenase type II
VDAYGIILREQGIALDGKTFYDKWMQIWRRLAREGAASDTGSIGELTAGVVAPNTPAPLSEPEPSHPDHHTPSAGRSRQLDGVTAEFRPYREEWPEHFDLCFEELGVNGDAFAAHERLRQLISEGRAFPESRRVVETVSRRLPIAAMSNADDDFLLPCLARNGLVFPVVVSSEAARAYKPHVAIFDALSEAIGVPHENILYVGDSRLADVVGAKNAGLHAAWLRRRTGANSNRSIEATDESAERDELLRRFPPDYVIETLDEVVDIVTSSR